MGPQDNKIRRWGKRIIRNFRRADWEAYVRYLNINMVHLEVGGDISNELEIELELRHNKGSRQKLFNRAKQILLLLIRRWLASALRPAWLKVANYIEVKALYV